MGAYASPHPAKSLPLQRASTPRPRFTHASVGNAVPLPLLVFPNKLDEVNSIHALVSVDAQGRDGLIGMARPWARRRRSSLMLG